MNGGPGLIATYAYDSVDELTSVTQASQTRTFVFDSLQRIMSATNPENGTVSYSLYDSNGNLKTSADSRNTTTSYTYDLLNRITAKSYSDGTPTVSYTDDDPSVPNGKGQLTKISNSDSATNYTSFDSVGNVTGSSQTTGNMIYKFGYAYNLANQQTSETYPSGRVVTTGYDAANRANSIGASLRTRPRSIPTKPSCVVSFLR
jgi:YD repeat-containing protein